METIRGLSILSMCLFIMCNISETLDTSMLERICNGDHYTQDSVDLTVEYVIHEIEMNTADQKGFEYYIDKYLNSDWTIRGHGVCTSTLSPEDCSSCLTEATHRLQEECTKTIGAQVQLEDCRIRYEKYHFNNDG